MSDDHERTMLIREYKPSDWDEWLRMSKALFSVEWSEADVAEMHVTLARPDAAVFVLERPDGSLAGYVEAGARSIVDGCVTSPVGYIEAWYVDPDVRRGGHGRALLQAAEAWARNQGYQEMGSDALLDNHVSHMAHERSGYTEVDRVVTYRKDLR
jgi:aminoglycoside 6'-N-acetyltransferase I